MSPRIPVDQDKIEQFCRRHHIRKLALFGSVLRDDFRPDSDVDVLVEFEPEHVPGFFRLFDMERELSQLMDGRVQFDGALYRTTVDDMQFFEFLVGSFGLLRVVSNLDKVEILGGELSATVHVNENLRFYGGANFIESDIKANSSRPDTVGNKAPYTPAPPIVSG